MHLTFLADRAGCDVDTADSEQLLLPGLRSLLVICNSLACAQEFTAYRDVIFTASVCQQSKVSYLCCVFTYVVKAFNSLSS